jgi:hypothetical protein
MPAEGGSFAAGTPDSSGTPPSPPGSKRVPFREFTRVANWRLRLWVVAVGAAVIPNLAAIVDAIKASNFTSSAFSGTAASVMFITAVGFFDLTRFRRKLNRDPVAGFGTGLFGGLSLACAIMYAVVSNAWPDGLTAGWSYGSTVLFCSSSVAWAILGEIWLAIENRRFDDAGDEKGKADDDR